MGKMQNFLQNNSATILSFVAAGGVISTTILAIKATPKALDLINDKEIALSRGLTPIEKIKVAWKPYVPTIISGTSTVLCIFGANHLNRRTQASLISSYALLDKTYQEYRGKLKEEAPEVYDKLEQEAMKSRFDPDYFYDWDDEKDLFYDMTSMRYFQSTMDEIKDVEDKINERLCHTGYACLNDIYDCLGLKRTPYGFQLGWCLETSDGYYGAGDIHFDTRKTVMDDGLECTILELSFTPEILYEP